MEHSDEQIFLLCIWKELNEPLPAMMANHGKAGSPDYFTILSNNINKSPVHLITLSQFCWKSSTAVSLRGNYLPRCRHKILVLLYINFYRCESAFISKFLQPFKTDLRVGYVCLEEIVQYGFVTWKNIYCIWFSLVSIWLFFKIVLFQPPKFSTRYSSQSLKLSKIYFFIWKIFTFTGLN